MNERAGILQSSPPQERRRATSTKTAGSHILPKCPEKPVPKEHEPPKRAPEPRPAKPANGTPPASEDGETEEQRRARHRDEAIKEIITTEQMYIQDLEFIVKVPSFALSFLSRNYFQTYIQPLEKREILTKGELNALFSNLVQILEMHRCVYDEIAKGNIWETFFKMAPFFKIYSLYCTNYDGVCETIEKLTKVSPIIF